MPSHTSTSYSTVLIQPQSQSRRSASSREYVSKPTQGSIPTHKTSFSLLYEANEYSRSDSQHIARMGYCTITCRRNTAVKRSPLTYKGFCVDTYSTEALKSRSLN